MKKKFISIIWGYHKQIFSFDARQNYHMMPLKIMKDEGYDCEIFAIASMVNIKADPNFITGTKVVYYKNLFQYLHYLFINRNAIVYSNSITLKTLIVGIIGNRTVFCPHSFPFGNNRLKKVIIIFLYKFFTRIRINNDDEHKIINSIRKNLAFICPLVISEKFYTDDIVERNNICVWIGNITPIKGPEALIQAAIILKNRRVKSCIHIIGEDRYNKNGESFLDLIQKHGVKDYFYFHGSQTSGKIQKILKKSLIYINTSISEGQCLAVYEAALAGNILCLQNISSFPSVFKKEAFYHNNPKELAKNIERLLSHKGAYENMIKKNQNMILENYDYTTIAKKLKILFLNI